MPVPSNDVAAEPRFPGSSESSSRVHSRTRRPEWEASFDARFVRLPELLERSDFVTLHCPLTPRTRHLIDDAALARMKPTACLVNTARGPVVDEAALVRLGEAGHAAVVCGKERDRPENGKTARVLNAIA